MFGHSRAMRRFISLLMVTEMCGERGVFLSSLEATSKRMLAAAGLCSSHVDPNRELLHSR